MRIHGTTFRPVEQLHVVREHRGSDRSLVLYHLLQRHPRSELFHRQRRTLPRVVARRGARMGGRSPVPARLLLFLPDAALRSGCPLGEGVADFNDLALRERDRNPWDECVDWVAEECRKAAADLPLTQPDSYLGRATKGVALALRARLLLYAARPCSTAIRCTGT